MLNLLFSLQIIQKSYKHITCLIVILHNCLQVQYLVNISYGNSSRCSQLPKMAADDNIFRGEQQKLFHTIKIGKKSLLLHLCILITIYILSIQRYWLKGSVTQKSRFCSKIYLFLVYSHIISSATTEIFVGPILYFIYIFIAFLDLTELLILKIIRTYSWRWLLLLLWTWMSIF